VKFGTQCRRRPGFTWNTKCLKCVASKVKCDYAGLRGGSNRRGRNEQDDEDDEDAPPRKKVKISIKKPALPTIRIAPRPVTRLGAREGERTVEETPARPAGALPVPEPRARRTPPPVRPLVSSSNFFHTNLCFCRLLRPSSQRAPTSSFRSLSPSAG
jgi:hypothetical protein